MRLFFHLILGGLQDLDRQLLATERALEVADALLGGPQRTCQQERIAVALETLAGRKPDGL
jgi:hypothetical protein